MKNLYTLILFVISISVSAQTADDYLQSGLSKHNMADYKGAIKDYDMAIASDKNFKVAYFNRAVCKLAINELKPAMVDFNKVLELDPSYAGAYLGKATVFVNLERYSEALPLVNKTIELDPRYPDALILRGQIRAQTGNLKGACNDFSQAERNGDHNAERFLEQFCSNNAGGKESLSLNLPEKENWKVGFTQEDDQMKITEFIHSNESLEHWTEMGYMSSIKSARNTPPEKAMKVFFEQAQIEAPNARLTFIEKNDTTEFPWIIFTIESPNFVNDPTPESQLWYVVQGKKSLYANFIAIKVSSISKEYKEKWMSFFKTVKVVINSEK